MQFSCACLYFTSPPQPGFKKAGAKQNVREIYPLEPFVLEELVARQKDGLRHSLAKIAPHN